MSLIPSRCKECGAALKRPNFLPLLLVPPVLGLLAWFGMTPLAARVGMGFAIALLSLPFLAFVLYLTVLGRTAAAAMDSGCPECG